MRIIASRSGRICWSVSGVHSEKRRSQLWPTSVRIVKLVLVSRIFLMIFSHFCDDFDSKLMIWCSNFSRMIVDAKAGTERKNVLNC